MKSNFSPLVDVEQQYWNGLTTPMHLHQLYMKEPQIISNTIENVWSKNIGGDDLVRFTDQFSTTYVDDPTMPYEWYLQGADERNFPIVDYWKDFSASGKPDKPGIGHGRFVVEFAEHAFRKEDIIAPPNPEDYYLRIVEEPQSKGTNTLYMVELFTGDEELFVDPEDLEQGTRWSKQYSAAGFTLSSDSGDVSHVSPFKMSNRLSMIRKSTTVPGSAISQGKNKPLAFQYKIDGKKFTSWINRLDWEMMKEFRRERARLLLYGKSNRKVDGSYANKQSNGYAIESGFGLYQQMSGTNTYEYNTFDLDKLTEIAMGLTVGKVAGDTHRFVLVTGSYGAWLFHKAAEEKGAVLVPQGNPNRIQGVNSGDMTLMGGQFMKYRTVNGITFEIMIDDMKDDPVIHGNRYHPSGQGLLSSYEFEIFDFGTSSGQDNIVKVEPKQMVDRFAYTYMQGLRSPYGPGGNDPMGGGQPIPVSSTIDGYEINMMYTGGMKIHNPMRTARYLPAIA